MFTVEDYRNLLILINRARYDNLPEAKTGVVLEEKLRKAIEAANEAANERPFVNPDLELKKDA